MSKLPVRIILDILVKRGIQQKLANLSQDAQNNVTELNLCSLSPTQISGLENETLRGIGACAFLDKQLAKESRKGKGWKQDIGGREMGAALKEKLQSIISISQEVLNEALGKFEERWAEVVYSEAEKIYKDEKGKDIDVSVLKDDIKRRLLRSYVPYLRMQYRIKKEQEG